MAAAVAPRVPRPARPVRPSAPPQIDQHFTCRHVFELEYVPGALPAVLQLLVYMDFMGNVVFAVFVVVLNLLLLLCTVEYLDLVLNCTATLFILEVPDMGRGGRGHTDPPAPPPSQDPPPQTQTDGDR